LSELVASLTSPKVCGGCVIDICGQVNQILIASNMVGVVEGLLYAQKAGLNMDDAIAAVGAGAAGENRELMVIVSMRQSNIQ